MSGHSYIRRVRRGFNMYNFAFIKSVQSHLSNTQRNLRTSIILSLILCLVSFFSVSTKAQPAPFKAGTLLKVSAPNVQKHPIKGRLSLKTNEALILDQNGSEIFIPLDLIESIKFRNGVKRNTLNGLVLGAVTGSILSATVAAISSTPEAGSSSKDDFSFEPSPSIVLMQGAVIGSIAGGLAGSTIGFFIINEKWDEIPLQVMSSGLSAVPYKPSYLPGFTLRVSLD